MTLREKLENINKSEIIKLMYDGKVLGLRVKVFNVNTDVFEYYDFTLNTISGNQSVKNFINSLQNNMNSVDLIEHNGILASNEEINGSIIVKEFKTEHDAIRVLSQVKTILEA